MRFNNILWHSLENWSALIKIMDNFINLMLFIIWITCQKKIYFRNNIQLSFFSQKLDFALFSHNLKSLSFSLLYSIQFLICRFNEWQQIYVIYESSHWRQWEKPQTITKRIQIKNTGSIVNNTQTQHQNIEK